jgi:hypothetical protein
MVDLSEELTIVANDIKLTFLSYPFKFNVELKFNDIIKVPDVTTLAAIEGICPQRGV